jgi:hypothetical protein
MPAPVIDPTTSVLAWQRGRYYAFQPALTAASTAADSWAIASGSLPTGVSIDEDTGLISGVVSTEAQGSIWVAQLVATNGSGPSSPVRLTFGVEYPEIEIDGAIHCVFDLDSGAVAFRGLDQVSDDGLAVVHCKANDQFPLSVQFVRREQIVELPITELQIAGKINEPEPPVALQAANDDTILQVGSGETARYLIWVDLTAAALDTALFDYEDDDGTTVSMLAELRAEYTVDLGEELTRTASRSSLNFWLVLHRDLA